MRLVKLLALMLMLAAPQAALAVIAEEPLADSKQEERAVNLFHQLRCVVCEGQPLAESDTGVAQDIRRYVREQVAAGHEDEAILDFLTDRYGEKILQRPRFDQHTYFLWLAPLVFMFCALSILIAYFGSSRMVKKE